MSCLTCLQLKNKKQLLKTGCSALDILLNGGIDTMGITEICGESSVGKTQLCFQLCCTVQLPCQIGGLNGSACYITSDFQVKTERLSEIGRSIASKEEFHVDWDFNDNIYIQRAATSSTLLKSVTDSLPKLIEEKSIKLIVIDSLPSIIRGEFEQDEITKRSNFLGSLVNQLQTLSYKYELAVVVVNEVVAQMNEDDDSMKYNFTSLLADYQQVTTSSLEASASPPLSTPTAELKTDSSNTSFIHPLNDFVTLPPYHSEFEGMRPSLGLFWSSSVNTRLLLSHTTHSVEILFDRRKKNDDEDEMEERKNLIKKKKITVRTDYSDEEEDGESKRTKSSKTNECLLSPRSDSESESVEFESKAQHIANKGKKQSLLIKPKKSDKVIAEVNVRRLSVIFSPRLPISSVTYLVTQRGIESYRKVEQQ